MKNSNKALILSLVIFATFSTNATFSISDTSIMKESHVWVRNNSSVPLTLLVERIENTIPDTSENYFCWGSCYPPFVSISTDMVTIAPGATDKINFIGDYEIKGGEALIDTAQITYCFIDDCYAGNVKCFTALYSLSGPADSLYQMIAFDTSWCTFTTTEPINHIAKHSIKIHPNPVQEVINLEYTLDPRDREGYFILRNMLGAEVAKVNLYGAAGKIVVPVSDLNQGVYFYSLVVGQKVYSTKKLIIEN